MEIDHEKFKCTKCEKEFQQISELMLHRKNIHFQSRPCQKLLQGLCKRSSEECWYLHEISKLPNKLDFQMAQKAASPDRLETLVKDLIEKVTQMEIRVSQFFPTQSIMNV